MKAKTTAAKLDAGIAFEAVTEAIRDWVHSPRPAKKEPEVKLGSVNPLNSVYAQLTGLSKYVISVWGYVHPVISHPTRLDFADALKTFLNDGGYPKLKLVGDDGKSRGYLLHRLVAHAFLGPCPDGMEVLHGDRGKECADLGNLRYGTRAENHADKVRAGTAGLGVRKLTPRQVAAIHRSYASPAAEVARRYGIGIRHVRDIRAGKKWSNRGRVA